MAEEQQNELRLLREKFEQEEQLRKLKILEQEVEIKRLKAEAENELLKLKLMS